MRELSFREAMKLIEVLEEIKKRNDVVLRYAIFKRYTVSKSVLLVNGNVTIKEFNKLPEDVQKDCLVILEVNGTLYAFLPKEMTVMEVMPKEIKVLESDGVFRRQCGKVGG